MTFFWWCSASTFLYSGHAADKYGRKPLFVVALCCSKAPANGNWVKQIWTILMSPSWLNIFFRRFQWKTTRLWRNCPFQCVSILDFTREFGLGQDCWKRSSQRGRVASVLGFQSTFPPNKGTSRTRFSVSSKVPALVLVLVSYVQLSIYYYFAASTLIQMLPMQTLFMWFGFEIWVLFASVLQR